MCYVFDPLFFKQLMWILKLLKLGSQITPLNFTSIPGHLPMDKSAVALSSVDTSLWRTSNFSLKLLSHFHWIWHPYLYDLLTYFKTNVDVLRFSSDPGSVRVKFSWQWQHTAVFMFPTIPNVLDTAYHLAFITEMSGPILYHLTIAK
jgi:hypothetical protein